ncbi:MmcQ/YjbR family DNA-binding protein [Dactylosporangium sp. CA-139066]|uniref:MmcQ/YjbR family DNA-binding protein n=1 Tax=Dactylosporangium sp. CA-139066 TaxID=3239930 RepID=UPI003D8F2B7A
MVTLDEAAELARRLPETVEGESRGNRTWSVGGKAYAWERPFSKADLKRFGDAPVPDGPILAIRVGDLAEKEAVLAAGRPGFFTIPHFDGYAAVLVQLREVRLPDLEEALEDGWLVNR